MQGCSEAEAELEFNAGGSRIAGVDLYGVLAPCTGDQANAVVGMPKWARYASDIDVPFLRRHPLLELFDRIVDAVGHGDNLGKQAFVA